MPNFTPEDLLLYLTGELDEAQNNAITEELQANWPLREKFNVLKEAARRVDTMQLQSPRKQTVQSIIQYAMRKPVSVQ